MLAKVGRVFFEVVSTDRIPGVEIPNITMNIRNSKTATFMGQMRYVYNSAYSKNHIRMEFNMMNPALIYPNEKAGEVCLLKEIIAGGFLKIGLDLRFSLPKDVQPYMVLHDYAQDSQMLQKINSTTAEILREFGFEKVEDMLLYNPKTNGMAKALAFLEVVNS